MLAPFESKAARKQRRQRDRHKRGVICIQVEVGVDTFVAAMIEAELAAAEKTLLVAV